MANLVTIVMYHYVRNLKYSRFPSIKGLDIELFKQQIGYLKKHYNIIRMEDLIATVKKQNKLPQNSLLLTFDDGYKDHYDTVFPILNEYSIQGSFFPPVEAIVDQRVLDVNKIHFILASQNNPKRIIKEIFWFLDGYRDEYNLEENDYYYKKLAKPGKYDKEEVVFIKKLLQKELPQSLRQIVIGELFSKLVSNSEKVFARELYMNDDQIRMMIRNGMYFGAHGDRHCWLNILKPTEQEREIAHSIDFLNSLGATTVDWAMCYPYGGYDHSLLEILRRMKCSIGLTTNVAVANLSQHDPLLLPRLDTNDLPKDRKAPICKWTKFASA